MLKLLVKIKVYPNQSWNRVRVSRVGSGSGRVRVGFGFRFGFRIGFGSGSGSKLIRSNFVRNFFKFNDLINIYTYIDIN